MDIIKFKKDTEYVFNEIDFKFLKMVIENTFKFWADCIAELDDFPWDLFETDDVPIKNIKLYKDTLRKLNKLGINTFGLENYESKN